MIPRADAIRLLHSLQCRAVTSRKHPRFPIKRTPLCKAGFEAVSAEARIRIRAIAEGTNYKTGDDIYVLFDDASLHPYIHWIGEMFSVKTPELKKPQIVAAMYATYTKNEPEARKFWASVARGGDDFGDDTAPATVLDRWLAAIKEEDGRKRELKPAHYYYGSIFAWNAYREDRAIKDIRWTFKTALRVSD